MFRDCGDKEVTDEDYYQPIEHEKIFSLCHVCIASDGVL